MLSNTTLKGLSRMLNLSIAAQLRLDAKIQPYDDISPFFAFTILTRSAKLLSDIANHYKS
jgi:hypothetical protein